MEAEPVLLLPQPHLLTPEYINFVHASPAWANTPAHCCKGGGATPGYLLATRTPTLFLIAAPLGIQRTFSQYPLKLLPLL